VKIAAIQGKEGAATILCGREYVCLTHTKGKSYFLSLSLSGQSERATSVAPLLADPDSGSICEPERSGNSIPNAANLINSHKMIF